jgi:hypothetical protein
MVSTVGDRVPTVVRPKSLASELQELAALRDMGVLSEEEFLKAKKKLLD